MLRLAASSPAYDSSPNCSHLVSSGRQPAPGPRDGNRAATPVRLAPNQLAEASLHHNASISRHVNRALADGGLDPEATVADSATVQSAADRTVGGRQGARIAESGATVHVQHPQKRRRPRAMGACSRKDARHGAERRVASARKASSSDPAALRPSWRHRQPPGGPAQRQLPAQSAHLICRQRPKPQRQAPPPDHNTPDFKSNRPEILFARHLQSPVAPTLPAAATPIAPLTAEAAAHRLRDGHGLELCAHRPPTQYPALRAQQGRAIHSNFERAVQRVDAAGLNGPLQAVTDHRQKTRAIQHRHPPTIHPMARYPWADPPRRAPWCKRPKPAARRQPAPEPRCPLLIEEDR